MRDGRLGLCRTVGAHHYDPHDGQPACRHPCAQCYVCGELSTMLTGTLTLYIHVEGGHAPKQDTRSACRIVTREETTCPMPDRGGYNSDDITKVGVGVGGC